MPKIKTITLGCRFNFYESEVSKAIVESLSPTEDVLIINTCAVTHEAERQSKQAVRKAIRENKGATIIVTGCATKTAEKYFKNLEGIAKVILNENKAEMEPYLDIPHSANAINFNSENIIEENDQLFQNRARAFIQIQNGCNNFCTYCIVPFTRGSSRSLPLEVILRRVRHFVDIGFKELVLSGIDITSYGKDLQNFDLSDVIKEILNQTKLERLRISSLDPKGIDKKLFDLITHESRIMPHFHLSIQSGDNDVLKSMRRRHTREDIIKFCNDILDKRTDVVFGSDFIAGFPTETESMFENTVKLIDEAHLSLLHVFPFSPRKGTIASQMIQLPRDVILDRAKKLRIKAGEAKQTLFKSLIGKKIKGIVESSADGVSTGKTDSFVPFSIKQTINPSSIINFEVIDFSTDHIEVAINNKDN